MHTKFKNIIGLFLLSVALWASPARASLIPESATEAVFYAFGAQSARTEADAVIAEAPAQEPVVIRSYSFRAMAEVNKMMAGIFMYLGARHPFVFYLLGRAAAFEQLADLAGEP